uniref:J domain-containing protein n=1 Tax=Cupriavidus ulmosensis TaxID=3065913 RepID=UPI00296ADFC9|nr:DnaJ domain-containing protein [Cupriavidus sp. CV2]
MHTHYDNLKISRDAPPEIIRATYKVLSQKHHPDRNNGSPESQRIMSVHYKFGLGRFLALSVSHCSLPTRH